MTFKSTPEKITYRPSSKQSDQPCQITFSLLQDPANLIPLLLAELAHKRDVDIRDASALDALVALETAELLAHVVQVVLEIVVDAFLHRGKAALFLRIPVSEVVTIAGGQEVEFTKFIGRTAAAVVVPIETGGVLRAFGGDEGGYAVLEKELV